MTATDTPEPTATELAASAAGAVRTLNHRTLDPSTIDASTAAAVLADVMLMVDRLPQLFGQLGDALDHQATAGAIRLDADGVARWPTALRASAEAVGMLHVALTQAEDLARTLRHVGEITSTMGGLLVEDDDEEWSDD